MSRLLRIPLLGVFFFAGALDPIQDALKPHEGECALCVAIAGSMVSVDPGPVLSCETFEIELEVEPPLPPIPCADRPVHLGRGPPAV